MRTQEAMTALCGGCSCQQVSLAVDRTITVHHRVTEPRDGGQMRGTKRVHAPRPEREDAPDGNLLLPRHVQAPQHHHRHKYQHPIGGDVQHGLRERDVVEACAAADVERVTGPGEDGGEDDGVFL